MSASTALFMERLAAVAVPSLNLTHTVLTGRGAPQRALARAQPTRSSAASAPAVTCRWCITTL